MSHSGDEFAGMAHGRDGEETFEDIYEEGEHHEEVPLTAMKRKRADGIEEKEDGEPFMPANLDDAIANNRKFDTAESALMAVYQQSLMAYCVLNKIRPGLRPKRKARTRAPRTLSAYSFDKIVNSPKIPKSCVFDPTDETGKCHKEPIDFNEEFNLATNLMTNMEIKKYYYAAALRAQVHTMMNQEDKIRTDNGDEPMNLDEMQQHILKKYATIEYKDKLYHKADNFK